MQKFWREYWILIRFKGYGIQLINNWHFWRREEWYFIGFFFKYRHNTRDFYFAFFGFQLRFLKYSK
jgi:hypothetical protein